MVVGAGVRVQADRRLVEPWVVQPAVTQQHGCQTMGLWGRARLLLEFRPCHVQVFQPAVTQQHSWQTMDPQDDAVLFLLVLQGVLAHLRSQEHWPGIPILFHHPRDRHRRRRGPDHGQDQESEHLWLTSRGR